MLNVIYKPFVLNVVVLNVVMLNVVAPFNGTDHKIVFFNTSVN